MSFWLIFGWTQSNAATLTVLHAFNIADGFHPAAALLLASDGNFYGTTEGGGGAGAGEGAGTVYRIDPLNEFSRVHVFQAGGGHNEGTGPRAKLVENTDGSLFGTTSTGGRTSHFGVGVVFKATPAGDYTLLHSFSGSDGAYPEAGLTLGSDGNFYGVTSYGGGSTFGTIFKIAADGTFTSLHLFSGSDGANVKGALVEGTDGNFYGTTYGSDPTFGTIFRISPDGDFTSLHTFTGDDGAGPLAGLILGADGNFYGTTSEGGPFDKGTIFQFRLDGTLTTLHSFAGEDGAAPQATLLMTKDGNFYGTTAGGGTTDLGTIFQLTPGNKFSSLYSFSGVDGANPVAELTEAGSGTFIGTTYTGGASNVGTVFRLDLAGSPAPPQRLLNISTRANVRSGTEIAIGGFIITGADSKPVLVRGIGPSLGNLGLTDPLPDPMLALIDQSGSTIQINDDWKETQQTEIEATGAAPTNDLESALIATLPPGAYTALLQDANSETGIGLVEVYDLGDAASQLANLSTRAFADIEDNVLIGGTIVGGLEGTGPTEVIVRAIGPSLEGVNGTLLDPTLELHDSDGALVASNDNWKDTQEAEIEAAGLAPADDRESAIKTSFAAGSYTAVVRGKDDTTGVALVEIYNLGTSSAASAGKRRK